MTRSSSIHVPHPDEGCAFCAYISGKRNYTIVARSAHVAVMITQEPRGEPHALVVPVRHCETILGLTDTEAAEVMIAVREVAKAIDLEFCRPGIAVWQNNGVSAHQAIGHVHVHVAGTLEQGGTDWGEVPEVPMAETERVADRLRPHLRRWAAS